MTFLLLGILLLAPLAPDSPDAAWQDFKTWFSKAGRPGAPADVLKQYSAQLASTGIPEAEVRTQVGSLERYIKERPREALELHFDRMYLWQEAPFRKEPSAFLQRIARDLKPGRALDIAMGQGRNSLWLASQGWEVTGYDLSPEGLSQARTAAQADGLKVRTIQSAHDQFEFGQAQWDLIVMVFAFLPVGDEALMIKVKDSLKPGGVILIEGFNGPTPGHRSPANMLMKPFPGWRILAYEDLPDVPDWGLQRAQIGRVAAMRE